MFWSRRLWVFLVAIVGVFAALAGPSQSIVSASTPLSQETARLVLHFQRVEAALRERDVTMLTVAQRQARQIQIDRLATYRRAKMYPHHHGVEPDRIPYFVDVHGSLCAMAYLIARSGHENFVARVQQTANNATILELAADSALGPPLRAWLADVGLTLMEAQAIQPAYGPTPSRDVSPAYVVASISAGVVNAVTSGLVMVAGDTSHRRVWLHSVGLATGILGVGLGWSRATDDHLDAAAAVNFLLGLSSFVFNVGTLGSQEPRAAPLRGGRSHVVRPYVGTLTSGRAGFGVAFVL